MRIIFKGKNTAITPALRVYIQEKLVLPVERLSVEGATLLEIEVSRTTRHHRKGHVWWAEANLTVGKRVLRAEHDGEDPREVVDLVEEELKREIKSFKGKSKTQEIRGARKLKRLIRKNY
ncbi:MAG: HPF/RaiA family ribosome-associated protein [Candidatus Ryanbacteria bacterium]|nr:HPF/RaiA family ribosome-associated protein [Candidatus Ryanbacteria bacterium]